jgi:assimilatory nitrate reductase catalytic subunit
MHWGGRFLGQAVNELTLGALDPSSKQPELKHCAVRLERARLPWRLVAFGDTPDVDALFRALDFAMSAAPYAARTLIGRERSGVRLSLAAEEPLPDAVIQAIDAAYGLVTPDTIRYENGRAVALEEDRVRAARLCGDTRAEAWLRGLWDRAARLGALRRYLVLPAEAMPHPDAPRGRTVCNCFDVAEREIEAFRARSQSLAALQSELKCGTSCGSCLPELRRSLTT